jgi:hypothetical protein
LITLRKSIKEEVSEKEISRILLAAESHTLLVVQSLGAENLNPTAARLSSVHGGTGSSARLDHILRSASTAADLIVRA